MHPEAMRSRTHVHLNHVVREAPAFDKTPLRHMDVLREVWGERPGNCSRRDLHLHRPVAEQASVLALSIGAWGLRGLWDDEASAVQSPTPRHLFCRNERV